MRSLMKGPLLIVLLSTALTSSGAAQTLDENLRIFMPLIGHSSEGHFQDTRGEARPTITMSLESMLAGKAIRLVSAGFGMTRENIHHWDPEMKQIRHVALTSNGWVSTGVAIMRMNTNNPYDPIFLIWIENIDDRTTPCGARVYKIIPRDMVPDAHNAEFVLEE